MVQEVPMLPVVHTDRDVINSRWLELAESVSTLNTNGTGCVETTLSQLQEGATPRTWDQHKVMQALETLQEYFHMVGTLNHATDVSAVDWRCKL